MYLPSADHPVGASKLLALAIRLSLPVPSAFFMNISQLFSLLDVKAIYLPFADHMGSSSTFAFSVILVDVFLL